MGEIVDVNSTNSKQEVNGKYNLEELTEDLLMAARTSINNNKALSVPIAELSALGAGVASIIPAFNTVTQSTSIATDGLFRIANRAAGDSLKMAKNGNAWGAMKTATGGSKMVQLSEAGPLSATTQTVASFNPATMMMAVALYSIEKDIAEISEMQKKILTFLEVENESQIEADVETLMGIVTNYKYNWDNELSVASSHNLVMDIQNRARKNMIAYQKKVVDTVSAKKIIVAQNKVKSTLSDLEKKFKYYRLSLYTFSLASLMEIMLSGNFKEEYITKAKNEIKFMSDTYREKFELGSLYLEKLGNVGVESNVLKGIGTVGKTVGKLIGSIPLVKEGSVDEFLQDKGAHLHKNAIEMEKKAVKEFATVGNPGTRVFVEKMEDMIQIYNHTSQICFDNEKIYLLE
ncbi:hypothetical protein KQI77_01685 [Clostridium sp. MSJ-8]|uniref:hypothetical protein n=1 Tax=Clostridium sp. MSJ-8 TaxID=2841510 RepID=UPI001C0EA94D|nr:hypothetical protein [Clostridium sp. MSJ-8]MBU5486874.1 hypothetical protein [Clostridium sp. MSJ-8]